MPGIHASAVPLLLTRSPAAPKEQNTRPCVSRRTDALSHGRLPASPQRRSCSSTPGTIAPDLGVTKTHSRPHVSDDNPFSESQFKTLKYRPGFPDRFGSKEHARSFCQQFFPWYNTEHHHSGLGLLTPEVVHTQRAEQVRELRQQTLDIAYAYAAYPERLVRKPPQPPARPTEVWINPPPNPESGPPDSEKKLNKICRLASQGS